MDFLSYFFVVDKYLIHNKWKFAVIDNKFTVCACDEWIQFVWMDGGTDLTILFSMSDW